MTKGPVLILAAVAATLPSAARGQDIAKLSNPRFSYPSYIPSGGVVYESSVSGNWEIYEMSPGGASNDGVGIKPLTDSPSLDRMPSVSPDGRYVAFISDRGGNYDVYRMNRDGSEVVRLTSTDQAEIHPYWSPDSMSIVYNSRVPGEPLYAIWMMDRDGRNQREVLRDSELNSFARISPDGRLLVFDKWWNNDETNGEIMIMALASGALTRLTENSVYDGYPAWFPDSRHVLYSSEVDGTFKLFRIEVGGGPPVQLTFGPGNDQRGTVSSDGATIIFNREIDDSVEIYEMTLPEEERRGGARDSSR
jgi:TolB protein